MSGLVAAAALALACSVDVHFVNDGTSEASVVAGEKQFRVAPGAWHSVKLPYEKLEIAATFADGSSEKGSIDLRKGSEFRSFRAYALAGRSCFALVDVSAFYGQSRPFSIERFYSRTKNIEHGASTSIHYDKHGESGFYALPGAKVGQVGSRKTPEYRLYAIDCAGQNDAAVRKALVDRVETEFAALP